MTATNTIQEVGISVWSLDPARSAVHFKVRHMAIAWVRGDFRISKGTLQSDEDRTSEAIDAASVDSGEPKRDEYLRNAEFFDVEHLPTIHFRSTEISRPSAGTAVVGGQLTIRGVTRPVELSVTGISPATKEPWGGIRFAASASGKINRKHFGLTWNKALETGGALVADEILSDLDVEFVKDADPIGLVRGPVKS